MKILIIGADGQIGSSLLRSCSSFNELRVAGTSINRTENTYFLDITRETNVHEVFSQFKPDAAILCSALTNVDECEKNKDLAHAINIGGTESTAAACRKTGTKLVFLSTDYVFDGKAGPYSETDAPNPLNFYGHTKLAGEKIAGNIENSLIIRSCMVYSYAPSSLNYAMQVLTRLRNNTPVTAYNDQFENPTYAPELSDTIIKMILGQKRGIYHVAGSDWTTRHEFARQVAVVFGFHNPDIRPVSTAADTNKASRPLKAGLKNSKLFSETGISLSGHIAGVEKMKIACDKNI